MVVHSSRILTMEQKIAQTAVGNPDVLELTALSPNQVQISAKATGVTQVNLWDENKKLYTIDVLVVGDARELAMILRATFPSDAIKVTPVASSVMISGFVDKSEHIDRIIQIAEQYYPKVINNMTVGGCQQVIAAREDHGSFADQAPPTGLRLGQDHGQQQCDVRRQRNPLAAFVAVPDVRHRQPRTGPATTASNPLTRLSLSIFASGTNAFFGVLDAMREDDLAKILAEPTLTTMSGHPASFRAGGSFYIVPNGQNGGPPLTVKYGTQLDFVPIVLGNGRIRLDVRATISEPDPSQPSQFQPAVKDRNADTGAELEAGQTMAIAGLVQSNIDASVSGLPWISDVPYLGAAFRKVHEQTNEVELLILVTPELVEPLDANEVPPCGPGTQTASPSDWELFHEGANRSAEVPGTDPAGPLRKARWFGERLSQSPKVRRPTG